MEWVDGQTDRWKKLADKLCQIDESRRVNEEQNQTDKETCTATERGDRGTRDD